MNLSPYHAFAACAVLEKRIRELRDASAVPDDLFDAFEKYHYSLLHKLKSARYHTQTLREYLSSGTAQTVAPADLVYRVNFHFDGFLHVVGSASDIFAREVLSYFAVAMPPKVYFGTAHAELSAARPGDAILPLLVTPPWRQEFADYRNTATHESLIAASYTVKVDMKGATASKRLVFPVPDDPRATVPTTTKNTDIAEYCERTLKRVVSHFNKAYTHIAMRAKTSGSLPL